MLIARKILYRIYRLTSSARHRMKRRFTRTGLAVLAGLLVTATMGMDIQASLAYQAFILLLCLLVVSLVCSRFFRAKFWVNRLLPRFGTVGCPLVYRVMLRNRSPAIQSGLVLLENLADPRPNFQEFVSLQLAEEKRVPSFRVNWRSRRRTFEAARVNETPLPPVPPGQTTEVRLELLPVRRGPVRFTGVTVARPDPLGLVKAFVKLSLPQSVLILPKRYPLPAIALPGMRKYQQGGVALASSVGESDEYVSLRDYRHGDPPRRIHWRSWAKTGRPIVKEFEDEFFVRHALILDTFSDLPASELFEEAVSVAASFACTLQTQESLLDLLFVGPQAYCFTVGRGVAHTDQMLEVLASVRLCREKTFDALEHLVLDHVGAVSGCVCVLLAWDERRQQFIQRLKMLGMPLLVLVIAEAAEAGMADAGPLKETPESFHVLTVGAIEDGLAKL